LVKDLELIFRAYFWLIKIKVLDDSIAKERKISRSMQNKLENLIKEGREWIRLKQVYENARFPDSGTPAYIISGKWLSNYKKYILYDV